MKKIFALAVLALAAADTATAVPIHLDFTGTVTSLSWPSDAGSLPSDATFGSPVSGGFSFDTDQLYYSESSISPPYRQISFGVYSETGFADPIATIDIGGEHTGFGLDPGVTYGYLGFVDVCTVTECLAGWGENFGWNAVTDNFVSGVDGTFTSRYFSVSSANTLRLPDSPFVEYLDYFDGDDLTALSAVTLPLYELTGLYSIFTTTCTAGNCSNGPGISYAFSIDSIDRGNGARAVPEPGTIGLFAAALCGLVLFRRRRLSL
jgi:hypothetical protein